MSGPTADPHHDGSARYVADRDPDIDDAVRVRVHVPHHPDGAPAADHVVLRSVRDGEPHPVVASRESTDEHGTWWAAELDVHNPVTPYRFLLQDARLGYRWLNASGVHPYDVTDLHDFKMVTDQRLPGWVGDAVGYQIFPDRFARTETGVPTPPWAEPAAWDDPVAATGPSTPRQLYGGTLDGIVERLDHVSGLGANLVYLTPTFPARSNHRYDAWSFDQIDPVLGGDAAWERLVAALHGRGMRLVGDLTTNHTGDAHEWFLRARQDAASTERGFYTFTDQAPGYECWCGVPSLPKLQQASAEMRARLYEGCDSVVARWLARGQDGWRIDVANMTGRLRREDLAHQVAVAVRRTMAAVDPDAWLLAEHGHDASLDLVGSGWQGTMDYAGFTRPVWYWLNGGSPAGPGIAHGLTNLGLPVGIPVLDGVAASRTMRQVHGAMPWASRVGSTLHLDSHDTPRFRTVAGGGIDGCIDEAGVGRDRHLVGLALQMTMPGVPVAFMGDEIGLTGVNGEHSRTPYPWAHRARWDTATLDAYRTWIGLRHQYVALRHGSFRWVAERPESFTFLREHAEQTLLVHVVRGEGGALELPWRALGRHARPTTLTGEAATVSEHGIALPRTGLSAHLYLLEPDAR